MKRKRKGGIHFMCSACGGRYKKRDTRYFDAPRNCPLCRAKGVPILMSPKRSWMCSIHDKKRSHNQPPREWFPETWGHKYTRYLKSPEWEAKRMEVLTRDDGLCQTCGKMATQVHHITYKRATAEPLGDLVSLCSGCHALEHQLYQLRYREGHWKNQIQSRLLAQSCSGVASTEGNEKRGIAANTPAQIKAERLSQKGAASGSATAAIS